MKPGRRVQNEVRLCNGHSGQISILPSSAGDTIALPTSFPFLNGSFCCLREFVEAWLIGCNCIRAIACSKSVVGQAETFISCARRWGRKAMFTGLTCRKECSKRPDAFVQT